MGKVTLLDGSAGTALWAMADAVGVKKEPVWKYNIEHPEFVRELHRRYVAAGCEMIQTNTFEANRPSIARSSDYSVGEVIRAAVSLAKEAVAGTDVQVYASFGPLPMLLEPYGKLTVAETADIYTEMTEAAVEAGAGWIALETFMDVQMMKIAAEAAKKTGAKVICSMTFAKRRRTMMGDNILKIVDTLSPLGIDAIGMNCSAGPVEALDIIREYHETTDLPLYFKPNSGVGEAYSAEQFAAEIAPALEFVSFVGGCCGCDDIYIREIGKLL